MRTLGPYRRCRFPDEAYTQVPAWRLTTTDSSDRSVAMVFSDEVQEVVHDYLDGDYEVRESELIPEVKDVPLGKVAIKVRAATFTIDLRDSTGLLEVHQRQTAGKVHKAFLYTCARAVLQFEGQIRSFRGDGLLAMWPAKPDGCARAVRAAMTLKGLLSDKLKGDFGAYRELDYGIGIDVGDLFIIRAGTARDANNNDLVFISPAVNFSVFVAEQASGPQHIEICGEVYEELGDDDLYGDQGGTQVNMWTKGSVNYRGQTHRTMCTSWQRGP